MPSPTLPMRRLRNLAALSAAEVVRQAQLPCGPQHLRRLERDGMTVGSEPIILALMRFYQSLGIPGARSIVNYCRPLSSGRGNSPKRPGRRGSTSPAGRAGARS